MKFSILFATGDVASQSSGPYLSLKDTAKELSTRGHSVHVIGTYRGVVATVNDWSVNITGFRSYGPRSLHFAPAVKPWLLSSRQSFDVVSLQGVWLHLNHDVSKWAKKNRIPLMMTAHGNFNPFALNMSKLKKNIAQLTYMREVFSSVDCYQALTFTEYKALRDFGIKKPIAIIPNGLNVGGNISSSKIQSIPLEAQNMARICLYLGRLHPIKGVERLIYSWSKINKSADWHLVIAGDGDDQYVQSLRNIAQVCGCRNIHFIGAIYGKQKLDWISCSEFLALPSYSEAFPMTVLEGLSFLKTSLVTKACGLSELAVRKAIVETPDDDDSFKAGLDLMLHMSKEEISMLGKIGYGHVKDNYSWDRIASKIEDTYEWMLGGPRPEFVYVD